VGIIYNSRRENSRERVYPTISTFRKMLFLVGNPWEMALFKIRDAKISTSLF